MYEPPFTDEAEDLGPDPDPEAARLARAPSRFCEFIEGMRLAGARPSEVDFPEHLDG